MSTPADGLSVNQEKGCPWISEPHGAGSKEYAEWTRDFFTDAFGGEWRTACTDDGWWYSEEVRP